jgi:diaminopimelate epimerase
MGSPRNIQWDIPLRFEKHFLRVHYLNTGVPHVVIFTENIEDINLIKLGSYIRNYSLWTPQGTNVTAVQKKEGPRLKVRTYERGVEGETLACGTGAVAAALAAARQYQINGPICVETRLGEELQIGFTCENQKFLHVTLTGPAECTFEGKVDLETLIQKMFFLIASNSVISVKYPQEAFP